MNRQKFVAATVTTLVLFAIVRLFTPAPEPKNIEDVDEGEVQEEVLESTGGLVPQQGRAEEVLSGEVQAQEKVVSKKNTPPDMSFFFSTKSEYAYFKVKDGLALIGGDIVLGELSEEQKKNAKFGSRLLKDKPKESMLWPSAEIPFGFSEGFPDSLRVKVLSAVKYFNDETAMEFIPVDTERDEDAVVFQVREGAPCASYLGRIGGMQPVYMNQACSEQDVIHELMHALGFVHEQQREGRDGYIKVLWPNIEADYQYNFSILPDSLVHQYQGSVFNMSLKSVMMYHDEAFSKNGKKSMKSLTGAKIAPINKGLADIDKERLELLYGR